MTIQDRLRALGREEPFERAYLGGTFDCLHRGHLALFAAARLIARELVVSLNTDDFAARYKRRPLMPLADRMAVLESCRLVDRAIVNSGDENSRVAILHSGADCVVHGSDWQGDSLLQQMGLTRAWLEERRIQLVILPYTPWMSTTQLLESYAGAWGYLSRALR
jgi:cytidyltransferase-like protein